MTATDLHTLRISTLARKEIEKLADTDIKFKSYLDLAPTDADAIITWGHALDRFRTIHPDFLVTGPLNTSLDSNRTYIGLMAGAAKDGVLTDVTAQFASPESRSGQPRGGAAALEPVMV